TMSPSAATAAAAARDVARNRPATRWSTWYGTGRSPPRTLPPRRCRCRRPGRRRRCRQAQRDGRALPRGALDRHRPAVHLHEPLDDAEPQPQPLLAELEVAGRVVGGVEAGEERLEQA